MRPVSLLVRLAPLCAAVAVAVPMTGCSAEFSVGGGDQVSGERVAEDITEEYAKRESASGIVLTRLTCEEVEGEVGAPIECAGRNSREIDVEIGGKVTATDSEGLDYRWRIVRAYAPGTFYADAARETIEGELGRPVMNVACPTRIELSEGDVVSCEVRLDEAETATVELLLTDVDGGFDIRFAERGAAGGGGEDPGPRA